MAEQIIFYILAAIIAVFSILAVTSNRIIRSATYLLFVLLATAGLYVMLGFHYLMAVQIAVYAGGIMVLFIFAILLTNKPGEDLEPENKGKRILAAFLSLTGLAFCGHVIYYNVNKVYTLVIPAELKMQDIGHTLMGTEKYQYLLPFEIISILLLACIVGSLMIARKR